MKTEERLLIIEEKIGDISEGQAVITSRLKPMGQALEQIALARAETLHLLKQQVRDQKEHDDIFKRLRDIEAGKAACEEKHKKSAADMKDLKSNQKWGVVAVLGAIVSLAIKKLFW